MQLSPILAAFHHHCIQCQSGVFTCLGHLRFSLVIYLFSCETSGPQHCLPFKCLAVFFCDFRVIHCDQSVSDCRGWEHVLSERVSVWACVEWPLLQFTPGQHLQQFQQKLSYFLPHPWRAPLSSCEYVHYLFSKVGLPSPVLLLEWHLFYSDSMTLPPLVIN